MLAERIANLVQRAHRAAPAECVQLLAEAVGLACDPLQRIGLLLLVADAAGRAAREATEHALRGYGTPGRKSATWSQIASAAGLTKDTAFRQFHGGQALSWSPAMRGVRQTQRRPPAEH